MEWLILVLLVPAIVVPVVLLWGFVGCGFQGRGVPPPPATPVLTATPIATDAIMLEAVASDMSLLRYEIQRAKNEGPFEPLTTVTSPGLAFADPNLQPDITYNYKVIASFDSDPDIKSPESKVAFARPLAFAAVLTDNQPNFEGHCWVQRITSAQLKNSGTKVKITVRGSTAGSLTFDRIYLSQPALTGDAYDALPAGNPGGLTKVVDIDIDGPAAAVTLPSNTAKTLAVDYVLDRTKDLLVAFDINAAAGQGNIAFVPLAGAEFYFRPGTHQAAVADRIPNPGNMVDALNIAQGRHYLIEKIEVL